MEIEEIIEDLIDKNADDFEISKLIKEHIKHYLGSLNEIFVENQGKDFLVKHAKKLTNLSSSFTNIPCANILVTTCLLSTPSPSFL